MENNYLVGNSYINSIIGEGTFFRGDIDAVSFLRIDGSFKGNINSDGKILIGKDGRVESQIIADTVVVGGIVKGNIYASDRVIILNKGVVIGNIKSPSLVVEEDVIITGKCIVGNLYKDDLKDEVFKEEQKDISVYNPALKENVKLDG